MKISFKRVLSFIMVCAIVSSMVLSASAASSVTHTSPKYGGGSATVFYVTAKNKSTTYLRYTSDLAFFSYVDSEGFTFSDSRYGFFEILVYGKKSNGTWTQISKTNMKGTRAYNLPMNGYTQYKVRVYPWKTSTIHSTLKLDGKNSKAYWGAPCVPKTPTCTFTAGSNVKTLSK